MKVLKPGRPPTRKGGPHIFTFYSYKGGVGRSMALINIAALLARRGRRVLIIDLDLEAPGITYLAEEPRKPDENASNQQQLLPGSGRPGFVDAICDLLDFGTISPLGNSENVDPFARYIHRLDLTEFAQAELKPGESIYVHLMPAGDLSNSANYRQRLAQLSLEERYHTGEAVPLLEHFKNLLQTKIPDPFDYILVDSRTGLSAEAGAAVRDLSQHLVVLMGLNRQNREGTEQFIRILRAGEPRPQSLTLVVSPLPIGEDELADKNLSLAEATISAAWQSKKPIKAAALIPYHPRIALDERPHQRRRTNEHLSNAYARLLEVILWLVEESDNQLSSRLTSALAEHRWNDAAATLKIWPRGVAPWFLNGLRRSSLLEEIGKAPTKALVESLDRFVASSPDAAIICALYYQRSGDHKAADAVLERHVKEDRANAVGWTTAAEFWREQARDKRRALDWYQRGIKALPRSAKMRQNAAEVLWELKELSAAEIRFREALELKPDDPRLELTYARFLSHRRGRSQEAEQHYLKALQLDESSVATHGSYANFLWEKCNRLARAEEHYKKAIQLEAKSLVDHSNLAELLLATGRPKEGRQHLQRAWDIEPRKVREPHAFFLAALVLRLSKTDPARPLSRLLSSLQKGFSRDKGTTYGPLLRGLRKQLPASELAFYSMIAAVLTGKAKLEDLKRFRRWRALRPMPVEGPLFRARRSGNITLRHKRATRLVHRKRTR